MILLTGGLGYVGSHVCVALQLAGYDVLILDNLVNSDVGVLDRLERITGKRPGFIQGDIRNALLLSRLFAGESVDAVLHFAGLKAVGESIDRPLEYYDSNVVGSHVLLSEMRKAGVRRFVFSSSATVYGGTAEMPVEENAVRAATNPYGRTKLIIEDMLSDLYRSQPSMSIVCLRYFNPVGAHESGMIGERPRGVPNNLMPYLCQVAAGERDFLRVFGSDYSTVDGTGVRDFIHVMDLAEGHVAALRHCERGHGIDMVNLGTGKGHSVLELVQMFESVSGRAIPYRVVDRRPGDVAACWANPARAYQLFGWRAKRGLREMCEDSWRWQSCNMGGVA